jgi:hypothetical protein
MAARRQAAARLGEENVDVGVRARRWIEETAAHHFVAARLEHEAGAYPVEASNEVVALLALRAALKNRRAAGPTPPKRYSNSRTAGGRHSPRKPSVQPVVRPGAVFRIQAGNLGRGSCGVRRKAPRAVFGGKRREFGSPQALTAAIILSMPRMLSARRKL